MNRMVRLGGEKLRVPHMLNALADASPALAMTLEHPLGDEIERRTLNVEGLAISVARGGGMLSVIVAIAPRLELGISADAVEGFSTTLAWHDADPEIVARLRKGYGRRIDGFVTLPAILAPFAASTIGHVERDEADEDGRVATIIDEAVEAAPLRIVPTSRRRNPTKG